MLQRSCFISAPIGTDLSAIRKALANLNVRSILPFELPIAGRSVAQQIAKAIREADFVIGILGPNSSANVFYELGFASALRKRLIVIAPAPVPVPLDVSEHFVLRTDPNSPMGLDFAVEQLLKATRRSPRKSSDSMPKSIAPGSKSEELLRFLQKLGPNATEHEVLNILSKALRSSGVSIVEEGIDQGADLVAWIDEVESLVANPVLIEFKRKITGNNVRTIQRQMLGYLARSTGGAAIVIYLENVGIDPTRYSLPSPLVLFIGLSELLERLRGSSIGQIIKRLRNKAAHGEEYG